MRAGNLRERVTIQQLVAIRDAVGEIALDNPASWQDVCTVYAAVVPLAGREFFASEQRNAEVSHRIEIRARPGITPAMRGVYKDRIFNITAVVNRDERDREMHLLCSELVGKDAA